MTFPDDNVNFRSTEELEEALNRLDSEFDISGNKTQDYFANLQETQEQEDVANVQADIQRISFETRGFGNLLVNTE